METKSNQMPESSNPKTKVTGHHTRTVPEAMGSQCGISRRAGVEWCRATGGGGPFGGRRLPSPDCPQPDTRPDVSVMFAASAPQPLPGITVQPLDASRLVAGTYRRFRGAADFRAGAAFLAVAAFFVAGAAFLAEAAFFAGGAGGHTPLASFGAADIDITPSL